MVKKLSATLIILLALSFTSPPSKPLEENGSYYLANADVLEEAHLHPPIPPRWVFEPWAWQDDPEEHNQASLEKMVNGYLSRDIPLGAVIIDSPWETYFNSFEFDRKRYPNPTELIERLHQKGVKVLLWITSLINAEADNGDPNPKYNEACRSGYFVDNCALYKWWLGNGSAVDFFNPKAVSWWHRQMDTVLEMGVDGWKVDMGEGYLPSQIITYQGIKYRSHYRDAYYRDFYNYTKDKAGSETIITARPFDYEVGGPFAPIDANPSGWVGDQEYSWGKKGLLRALANMFESAKLGYGAFGSDIGGYNGPGKDLPGDPTLFIRWAQLGAVSPIMENGGKGWHEPWEFDPPTVDIYRYFATLHHQLVPYLYSYAVKAHETGVSIMRPQPGNWQYKLGEEIFIAAIYENKNSREVTFPGGDGWIDYWDDSKIYEGGTSTVFEAPLDHYPIFIKEGAIIPMWASGSKTDQGLDRTSGKLLILVYPSGESSFDYYPTPDQKVVFGSHKEDREVNLTIENSEKQDYVYRVKLPGAPQSVTQDGREVAKVFSFPQLEGSDRAWFYDAEKGWLWITFTGDDANVVRITIN